MDEDVALRLISEHFVQVGLILESDPKLPSFVSAVAGGPVKGSWWGHAEGGSIYRVMGRFMKREDVLETKLVSGKVTFLHRYLWPQFLAVSLSDEPWQTAGLSKDAKALLLALRREGALETMEAQESLGISAGSAARELEGRLLAHSEQYHSAKGFHTKRLQTWDRWAKEKRMMEELPDAGQAKSKFEAIVHHLNTKHGGSGRLPWES
ncbi:MAG: hypothetical protein HY296_04790 [Thaumarchaeota archaeon]|nr:hypothetical protein [Nitrososphaerota archaeon]